MTISNFIHSPASDIISLLFMPKSSLFVNTYIFFIFKLSFKFYLFYVCEYFACMYVIYHMYFGSALLDDCESWCRNWELNLGALQKQVLLTA